MTQFKFEAIGTHWTVDIAKELSSSEEALLLNKIMQRIAEFDKTYSRFREDSLVTKISKEAGKYELPEDAEKMLSVYKKVYDITNGQVTPLIGNALSNLGYDAQYSFQKKDVEKVLKWEEVIDWCNPVLNIKSPVLLDFGAGGKGYLVDIVSELLEGEGIDEYCVDAGGDMRQKGSVTLKVGLEHPEDISSVIGAIDIRNQSLCGSAGNWRAWADYNHIINPNTLSSPKEVLAVWTLADETMLADILTTALSFVSPEELKKYFSFEYLVFYSDHTIKKSSGFSAEIFN
jgi:thiamine biosynthesis lipoprotein